MSTKYVVITGVSTGIGLACAIRLSKMGYHVFGSVRKQADADHVRQLIGDQFTPLFFDVTQSEQIQKAVTEVQNKLQGQPLTALINNAGIALGGPLLEIPLQRLRDQLEVNVVGLLGVTQAFASLLGADLKADTAIKNPGKVINIGSVSGVRAMPFVGPYTASKFALEGLNDSLRMELLPYGVDVVLVQPGPIRTAIWDKAPTPENHEYQDSPYQNGLKRFYNLFVKFGYQGLDPDEIAKIVQKAIESKSPCTRYVKTPGYFQRYLIPKLLPTRWFDQVIAKILHLKPELFWRKPK